jgi:ribonuclease P protein component
MKVKNRVKRHEEFQDIIHANKSERSSCFAVYYQTSDLGFARVGISVSKKNGNAVVRNKIKRQIRSIVDDAWDFRLSLNLIIVARNAYDINDFAKGKEQLTGLLQNIRRKLDDKKS